MRCIALLPASTTTCSSLLSDERAKDQIPDRTPRLPELYQSRLLALCDVRWAMGNGRFAENLECAVPAVGANLADSTLPYIVQLGTFTCTQITRAIKYNYNYPCRPPFAFRLSPSQLGRLVGGN